jgi:hypothetical protein
MLRVKLRLYFLTRMTRRARRISTRLACCGAVLCVIARVCYLFGRVWVMGLWDPEARSTIVSYGIV